MNGLLTFDYWHALRVFILVTGCSTLPSRYIEKADRESPLDLSCRRAGNISKARRSSWAVVVDQQQQGAAAVAAW